MQYKNKNYLDYEIESAKDDVFIIFSDGFQDQFGGPDNEKYGIIRLQEFFVKNYTNTLDQIKQNLLEEFISWKGEGKQMDDILFIGFKF